MRHTGKESIYDLVEDFGKLCLSSDRSLLWPEQEVWTVDNLLKLKMAFVDNPDEGEGTFLEKWKVQLSGQSKAVHRLATDLMVFYHAPHTTAKTPNKLAQLKEIIGWKLGDDIPDLDNVTKAFDAFGIANPGIYYLTARYDILAYFIKVFIELKSGEILPDDEFSVKSVADKVSEEHPTHAHTPRNLLLHLMFPDKYERSASRRHRAAIVECFGHLVQGSLSNDIDEALLQIRTALAIERNIDATSFDFYDDNIFPIWNPNQSEGANLSAENESFTGNYWIEMTNRNGAEVLDDGRFIRKFETGEDFTYITGETLLSPVIDMAGRDRFRFMRDVQPGDIIFHLTDATSFIGTSKVKSSFETKPLVVYGGYEPPSYAVQLCDYQPLTPALHRESFFGEEYKEALLELRTDYSNLFYHRNNSRSGIQLYQGGYLSPLPVEVLLVLEKIYRETYGVDADFNPLNKPDTSESGVPQAVLTIDDLSEHTYTDIANLLELEELLEEKRQVIIEGPPGSGKTFLANALARYLTANPFDGPANEQFEIVQFHQSYGYEDFVHGIRPVTASGQLSYEVQDGVFKRMCELAKGSDKKFIIVIDEINRGNLSRIFGELMLLLEYRNMEIPLSSSAPEEPLFKIPENLYLIGTMNTTDRSLAQIDYALRRRFYFYRLMPLSGSAAPVLQSWLEKEGISDEKRVELLNLFINLNNHLKEELDEHFQVGHSYFMNPAIAQRPHLERVWRHSIMPLLEEYFYARRDRENILSQFELDRLIHISSEG